MFFIRLFRSRTLLFAIAVVCVATSIAEAARRYVDNAATGSNNGQSWTNAYTALQDAFTDARNGSLGITEIWVAKSTHTPYPTPYFPDLGSGITPGSRDKSFDLVRGVTVYGGCVAGESDFTHRETNGSHTILSGDIGTVDTETDNSYHVVTATDAATGVGRARARRGGVGVLKLEAPRAPGRRDRLRGVVSARILALNRRWLDGRVVATWWNIAQRV